MSAVQALLGSIMRAGLTWLSRRRLPQTDGSLSIPGLHAPVEIIRDRWGVPHIYAHHLPDLFFAQGFVHAQDRLWQMEVNRRTAAGRLSELFGPVALDTDRFTRTFGFHRLAQADLDEADETVRSVLEAYAAGVNAFLERTGDRLPVEFTLLRHRPDPWSPLDSMAWVRVMIWNLSHAWTSELARARLIEQLGPERAADLEIRYPERNPITLPQSIEFNRLTPDGMLQAAQGPFLGQGFGSNGWAVSGRQMGTRAPTLCNDMHLQLQMPSIWYAVHLTAGPEDDLFHVTGVSLPGVPLVMVGHNARIAWGMTLAFTDCEDLFVEQFHPDDPPRYKFQDEWLEVQVIEESIPVKGRAEPHIERVLVTRHGPVISDVIAWPAQRLAVQSTALRPCPAVQGWLQLNQAQNWDEFVAAMQLIEAPQLNVPYADVDGNIGYWVTGRVPLRAKGQGLVPVPGWTGEYEWTGEVPFEHMPHALNPEQGYVVTCNHRIIPDDYPYYLGSIWMNGYRARRIVDVFEQTLQEQGALSHADMRGLHVDFHCIPGREFAAHLQGLSSSDLDVQAALNHLRAWNGDLSAESVAGTLYEVTRHRLLHNLYAPTLGPDLLYQLLGEGPHPLLCPTTEFYGHSTVTTLRMLDDPDDPWVQEAGGKEALLMRSLEEAIVWLRETLGMQMDQWQWGRLHGAVFPHTLGIQPPLDRVFNRGPYPIGGDTDTPCQTAYRPREPYHVTAWAPSYRQIVDMGDLSRSVLSFPPGQSGHLGSPHYDDLIEPWLNGEYQPMLWTREQVEQEAETRLRLEP
ncbi:MAG TPA: penicillin acylase family protein [Chloroflexi bacterium]|nr:penicillin acylase family protein [Chloroflexota bacterium]